MNAHKKIFYILFLLCISYCIEEDYIELESHLFINNDNNARR